MEYFGVFEGLFGHFVLISFRSYGGILMSGVGACDFLQLHDLFLRPLLAFFMIEWQSRKVIQVHVTRSPTDAWVARTAAGGDPLWRTSTRSDARY